MAATVARRAPRICTKKGNVKNNYYNFVVFHKDNILYAFAPFFQACGTINRKNINGEQTVYLKSK